MFSKAYQTVPKFLSSISVNAEDQLLLPPDCKQHRARSCDICSPVKGLPSKYSLSQLYQELVVGEKTKLRDNASDTIDTSKSAASSNRLAIFLILTSCLSEPGRLSKEADDPESIRELSLWISKSILPNGSLAPETDGPSDSEFPISEYYVLLQRVSQAYPTNQGGMHSCFPGEIALLVSNA